jgi:hypothetical protein
MFDIDGFVSYCRSVITEADPLVAIRDVLKRALARPDDVATALNPAEGGLWVLHRSDGITVVHVVWPTTWCCPTRPPHVGSDRDLHRSRGQHVLPT